MNRDSLIRFEKGIVRFFVFFDLTKCDSPENYSVV